jgi:phosphohistidine phosphatase SixA
MKHIFLIILGLLSITLACEHKEKETTLYLVRHAEKDTLFAGENPPLIEAGYTRAELLKELLKDVGIEKVYSTKFDRTVNTVQPLLSELNLTVNVYDYHDFHPAVDTIKLSGKHTLLCGHSDNLLPIIAHLNGQPPYESLGHNDYDNLFKLTVLSDTTLVEVIKF